MRHKKTHSDIVLPKPGEKFFIDKKRFEVVTVNQYTKANQYLCDCIVIGKDIQFSITINSKLPFKAE